MMRIWSSSLQAPTGKGLSIYPISFPSPMMDKRKPSELIMLLWPWWKPVEVERGELTDSTVGNNLLRGS